MRSLPAGAALLIAIVLSAPAGLEGGKASELIVHEWGTFTSVAGEDGRAVPWLPLNGPTDLPCFVERAPEGISKGRLFATVRMETPVVYFYTPVETTVDLDVRFPQGLMTEYFPPARVAGGTIAWNGVRVTPSASVNFPVEQAPSHYYAARATDAAPVSLNDHSERFLFYRGVGSFPLPLSATVDDEEEAVRVRNLGRDQVDRVVLFENHRGKVGYRVVDMIEGSATVARPRLDSNMSALGVDLERMLMAQGLFRKEAAAMVETWRDSWFEEGTRLFYVVPERTIASILPLRVTPQPAETVRVFVGRLEVITPAMMDDVRQAVDSDDPAALEKYGRFLQPIASRLLAGRISPTTRARLQQRLNSVSSPSTDRCGK
jgi:hypothetical protein